jgi:1,4-dihydroxy-2-naphthoyl-CoA hydrolase
VTEALDQDGSISGTVADAAATAGLHQTVPFTAHLGIGVVAAGPSSVTGRVAWQESLCTAGGALNGGVIMALADNVGALCAFLNLPSGAGGTTTIESKTNFLRAVRSGHATAIARPLHVGRRIIVVESDVLDDEKRLVARVTQSQAVL